MDYQKIYNAIIENAKFQNRKKLRKNDSDYTYYEKHHIVPKCLNGSDDENNKVLLTAREHFVCHKLLTYIYPNNKGIILAFFRLSYDNRNRKLSHRDYEYAKKF